MEEADNLNWLMAAGSTGDGDNTQTNYCGLAESHSFSILKVFTLIDGGNNHNLVMMRNPWGVTTYNKEWRSGDPAWTQTLKDQVLELTSIDVDEAAS